MEDIYSSREKFSDYLYTPWEKALSLLREREQDTELQKYVNNTLPHGLPEVMGGKKSMVLFRHIATPNYEVNRFIIAADSLGEELQPLILEYTQDKFNNRSDGKYYLGKIPFYKGRNRRGESLLEYQVIVDFNESSNKPLNSVTTHWGQSLVDFHHELFEETFTFFKDIKYDLSEWLKLSGGTAKDYYKSFLKLFLKDGVLFENFYIDESQKEFAFNRDIVIPAFKEIYEESGHKPLIVPLEPTHMEGDLFWFAHPLERKEHINRKIKGDI